MPSKHGTIRTYRITGCRCDLCKQAHAAEVRKRRDIARAKQAAINDAVEVQLAVINASANGEPGPVERGVLGDVAQLREPAESLVQTALAMARVLDKPGSPNQPSAAKQLREIMNQLRRESNQAPVGRLSSMRTMAERTG